MLYISGGPLRGLDQHQAARSYLSELYQGVLGRPMPHLWKTQEGQPFLGEPGVFCSLTHTKDGAFCALSDLPVGLDGEKEDRTVSLTLKHKILSPDELAQLESSQDPAAALLVFWVLKESYAKYTGQGLRFRMREFSFNLSGDRPRLETPAGQDLYFTLLRCRGHWLAVCSPLSEPSCFFPNLP